MSADLCNSSDNSNELHWGYCDIVVVISGGAWKAVVEKGSTRLAITRGLVGPK